MLRILISILIFSSSTIFPAYAGSIEPYVSTGIIHESNLFLLTNDEEAQQSLNSNIPSDTILQISPGVKGEISIRRQRFSFDLSLLRKDYDKFDRLNFTGGGARINWNWLYGRNWDGRASYNFRSEQSSFDEIQSVGDSKDIHLLSLTANRKLSPRYSLLSGISYRSIDFDLRDRLSKDSTQFEVGARYTSRSDNKLDLVYQYVDSEFPNRDATELARGLDTGFRDQRLLARTYWQATAKSLFEIEAGLTDRKQDNIVGNDFDGLIGSASYNWAISEKTLLKSSIWRELRDSEDQLTNFVKVDGIAFGIEWKNTAKITSFANLEYEDRDFQSNGLVPDALTKNDEYKNADIGISYRLMDNIVLTSAYRHEKRESNVMTREYKNDLVYLFMDISF